MLSSFDRLASALSDRYRLERELGKGGMATVYLAFDVRHDRQVAIKVLHEDLGAALGPDRFLAEIKTTARLQHPHILPLIDSGRTSDDHGLLYYVMPFVAGESLRDRLTRERQLPIDDAVRIAREVADALAFAHQHRIIHRDIKPENILLQGGHALVADFGIALAVQEAGGARMTQTGLSLGTPQYMAPEQAMGERTIDARADIYALGAVTYEMLTAEPPFTGATMQAVVARIIAEEPRPLSGQRKAVPPHVEAAVLKALEKLPADRFGTATEFAAALAGDGTIAIRANRAPAPTRRAALAVAAITGAVLGGALAWFVLGARARVEMPMLTARISAATEAPSPLQQIALSPDGAYLAYASSGASDGGRIWLRRLGDGSVRPLPDTEGARLLFWAPDGSAIGFFAAGMLRVVSLGTGAVRTLAPAPNPAGGAWSPNGTIVYSPFFAGLWRVPAAGGEPKSMVRLTGDSAAGGREPSFLPDGRHFLFWKSGDGSGTLWLGDLETGIGREIAKRISSPRYVDPGLVLFFQAEAQAPLEEPAPLFVQRFDVKTFAFVGEPMMLSPRVDRPDQVRVFSVTRDYLVMREAAPSSDVRRRGSISWVDRTTGRTTAVNGTGAAWTFRISHDGQKVALGGGGLWLYDPVRDVSVRMRTQAPLPWPPVWSPDDREIAVTNANRISIVTADGGAPERSLATSPDNWAIPMDWAPDKSAIYYVLEPAERRPHWELWRYEFATTKIAQVPTDGGNVMDARVAPDGKWVAWESDATGRREIYLGPTTGGGTPIRVSKAGGGSPRWRANGTELFFIAGDGRINVVRIQPGQPPIVSEPRWVWDAVVNPEPFGFDAFQPTRFDVSPSGDRLLVQSPPDVGSYRLTLIQGWQRKIGAASQ